MTRYAVGDVVRVSDRAASGHVRTPGYVRGRCGVVERICGAFRNPEELAYGRYDGARVPLYRVRFASRDLFPDDREGALDSVDVDLYEHWLEAEPQA
ncbi:MAG: hypothetical protein NVSMB21_18050 [Vulcanimicrobiaceae bacterium]